MAQARTCSTESYFSTTFGHGAAECLVAGAAECRGVWPPYCSAQIPVGGPATAKRLILRFIGAHREPAVTWTADGHWEERCGQSCGCCRAANAEDYPTGCSCCLNLWNVRCLCCEARARLRMYNGQCWSRLRTSLVSSGSN